VAKGDIFVRIGVDVSALEKALNKATEHIEKFGKQMKKIGRDLTEAITVPIVGLGYAALKSSRQATYEFDRFSENVKRSMGNLGDEISKAIDLHGLLKKASDAVAGLVTWFSNLDKETKKTVVTMAALAAALGPVLMIGGRLIEAFGSFLKVLVPLGFLIYKVVASIAIFASSIVGWPALIIAATVALVGFVVGWDKVAAAAKGAANWIGLASKSGGGGLGGSDFGGKYAQVARSTGGQIGAWRSRIPPATIPGAAPSGLSDASRNAIEDGPQVLAGTKHIVDGTQAMIDAQRKLGFELETTGNKAQYHEGMIAALKQEYIALREGGLAPTAPEIQKINEQIVNQNTLMADSQTAFGTFRKNFEDLAPVAAAFGNAMYGAFQQLAQGIGNALAQVIVYGASFAQVLKTLLKQILASIVSTLVTLGIQYLMAAILKKTTMSAQTGASLAGYASETFAAVFTAYTVSNPFAGWAYAAAPAAAASGALLAGAGIAGGTGMGVGKGIPLAAATGGLFTTPGLTAIAEKGKPEIVLNQDNVRKFMGGALGGSSQTIIVNLDSEPIISTVVRGMPSYLRLQGAI